MLDGVDQPALAFFPAWDVRESWTPWVGWAVAGLLFWVVAAGSRNLWRRERSGEPLPRDAPAAWKGVVSFGVIFLLGAWITSCSNGYYALRVPLARGEAVYFAGTVANDRFEGFGKNAWRLFDVAGQTFRMPFINPHLCVPKDGEPVRLWSAPRTVRAPEGTVTRIVLRLEMTRRCYIRPWG